MIIQQAQFVLRNERLAFPTASNTKEVFAQQRPEQQQVLHQANAVLDVALGALMTARESFGDPCMEFDPSPEQRQTGIDTVHLNFDEQLETAALIYQESGNYSHLTAETEDGEHSLKLTFKGEDKKLTLRDGNHLYEISGSGNLLTYAMHKVD